MKSCVQWNIVYGWKDVCLKQGSNPGPLDQLTITKHTDLPGFLTSVSKYEICIVVFAESLTLDLGKCGTMLFSSTMLLYT